MRVADTVPMGVETTCVPQSLCPDLLDRFDPRTSLYRTLLQVYGIHIVQADEVVEAGLADTEETASNHRAVFILAQEPLRAMLAKYVHECGLEAKLLEVVKMRVADQRLRVLYRHAGRDRTTPLGIERMAREAALQRARRRNGTEAVTLASQTHLPDEAYKAAREHHSERDCWIWLWQCDDQFVEPAGNFDAGDPGHMSVAEVVCAS